MYSPQHPAGIRRPRPEVRARLFAGGWLVPLSLLALAQLACGAGAQPDVRNRSAATHPPSAAGGTISVDARLFGFTLSSDTAEAGPVTFVVTNHDFFPHDFRITGSGVDEQTERIQPGDSATLPLDLAAGAYTYLCTVEGHSENMHGTFTVK